MQVRICICLQSDKLFFLGKSSFFLLVVFISYLDTHRPSLTCIDIASRAVEQFADTNASSIASQSLVDKPNLLRSESEKISNHFKILGVTVFLELYNTSIRSSDLLYKIVLATIVGSILIVVVW